MTGKHIRFSELEPNTPLDESHLERCSACRREWEMLKWLRFLTKNAPEVSPSPFFASRVTRLAFSSSSPWCFVVERMARWLVPAMAAMVLLLTSLLFDAASELVIHDDYVELLVEETVPEELTIEELILSLNEPGNGEAK